VEDTNRTLKRLPAPHRRLHPFVPIAAVGLLVSIASSVRADAYLPPIGGQGGSQFVAPCPEGQNVTGFELRTGDDVDAIRPVCVASYGPAEITAPTMTTDSGVVEGPRTPPISLQNLWFAAQIS